MLTVIGIHFNNFLEKLINIQHLMKLGKKFHWCLQNVAASLWQGNNEQNSGFCMC